MRGGAVRVGGYDVRDVTQQSLRSAIGMVMEESFLFSDSVRANIAYGRPDATFEQVVAAARAAEADEFIRDLPDGYDTVIGEPGLTLSGGQRQRVALARALITDPRLLLLDDATSAVDPRIEAEIHATLHRVMAGRTTLLIAHRRSTLNLANRVAVMTAEGLSPTSARRRSSRSGRNCTGCLSPGLATTPKAPTWASCPPRRAPWRAPVRLVRRLGRSHGPVPETRDGERGRPAGGQPAQPTWTG